MTILQRTLQRFVQVLKLRKEENDLCKMISAMLGDRGLVQGFSFMLDIAKLRDLEMHQSHHQP